MGLLEALEISQILQGQITALRPRNVPGDRFLQFTDKKGLAADESRR